jgi:ATP-dependent exoDNAse (exonuclease V) beta subunit
LHAFGAGHSVVWWDPHDLKLDAEPPLGIRRSELIVKDVAPQIVEAGLADYRAWRTGSDAAVACGARPSVMAQTVTQWAKAVAFQEGLKLPPVEIIEVPREPNRPSGPRFGALVHSVLGSVPLEAAGGAIQSLTELHGRTLGATDEEVDSAAKVVQTVLAHFILRRAREANAGNNCRREVPVTWCGEAQVLIEGVADLAFREGAQWTVVDFKTDEEFLRSANYGAQVGLYAIAIQAATRQATSAILMRI